MTVRNCMRRQMVQELPFANTNVVSEIARGSPSCSRTASLR